MAESFKLEANLYTFKIKKTIGVIIAIHPE